MSETELSVTLLAFLPIVRLEEKPSNDKCKYMIGTQAGMMLIKTNQIMIRVGGGFSTLEAYIRQIGSFECIKIFKQMRGNEDKNEPAMHFKEAVIFFLNRLKAPESIVKQFYNAEEEDVMGLFEEANLYLRQKQEENA